LRLLRLFAADRAHENQELIKPQKSAENAKYRKSQKNIGVVFNKQLTFDGLLQQCREACLLKMFIAFKGFRDS